MKIGILVLAVGNYGKKGMYNTQEIGLAKEFVKLGHAVKVYKCVKDDVDESEDRINDNLIIYQKKTLKLGSNSISSYKWLDTSLDVLICFSDIQLMLPKVYKWSVKYGIKFIPYVGITESTSNRAIVRKVINIFSKKIFTIYEKNGVLVKTNFIKHKLEDYGVYNVTVAPVGLDFSLLNKSFENTDKDILRKKYGFDHKDIIVLLVGRLENDRNPLEAIELFAKLVEKNFNYKLLVIGRGSLQETFLERVKDKGLYDRVKYIEKIPNNLMWEIYRISDMLITFSKTEIFGMSILEAMYYGTPVFAFKAPGPNDILADPCSGCLSTNQEEMLEQIEKANLNEIKICAHERVSTVFSWRTTANIIIDKILK